MQLAKDQVQFFPAKLNCKDGELEGYSFLNVTRSIKGIDHKQFIYTKMLGLEAISGFKYLTYLNGCMGFFDLAHDTEYLGNLLVSETLKTIFKQEK